MEIKNGFTKSREGTDYNKYRPVRERNIFLNLMVNVMKIDSVYTRQNQKLIYKVKRRNRCLNDIFPTLIINVMKSNHSIYKAKS